ncbi:MAG: DUF456 domain-containing protein [Deltaproteobacteria bacterium]|nr:DUF456 domain-containing protein [Deltaproteobacteria bacterium]
MTAVLIILGIFALILALAGCVVPVLPGPFLAYAALLFAAMAKSWEPFSGLFLVLMGVFAVLVSVSDNILPLVGARRYGASRMSVLWSVVGMVAGIFIFPPWTIFMGAFAGAVMGEWIDKGDMNQAVKAGWGVFMGTVASMALKLAYVCVALVYFIKAVLF